MGIRSNSKSVRKHVNLKAYFQSLGVNIGSFSLSLAEEIFQLEQDGTTPLDQLKKLCVDCGMGFEVVDNRIKVGKIFKDEV